MAYDEKLAQRVRRALGNVKDVEEKEMFRGLTFMVNGKMCIAVSGAELMCRFDPAVQDEAEEKHGFRQMVMKGRQLTGYGYVAAEGLTSKSDFDYWISLALDFNTRAKSSKKKAINKSARQPKK